MEKITYGAPRLVDWVAQIKAGSATVRVHFTGGALTSYGVTPAEYTTENPFLQKVIEQSNYFKEGRIILLRKTEIPGAAKPSKGKPKPHPRSASALKPAEEAPVAVAPGDHQENSSEVSSAEDGGEADPPAESTEEAGAESSADGMTIVETSCLQDAQAYLQENYNISSYKVRTCEAAQRAGAEHGVRFAGGKFDTLGANERRESETAQEEE